MKTTKRTCLVIEGVWPQGSSRHPGWVEPVGITQREFRMNVISVHAIEGDSSRGFIEIARAGRVEITFPIHGWAPESWIVPEPLTFRVGEALVIRRKREDRTLDPTPILVDLLLSSAEHL